MTEGEVVAGEPREDKKTYRWARTLLGFNVKDIVSAAGHVAVLTGGKKRSR